MRADLTRRNFLRTAAKGSVAFAIAGTALPRSSNAADPPVTMILTNEAVLRRKFPNDAAALMNSAKAFAAAKNGVLLDIGSERNPRAIKARVIQHSPRPKGVVILGDEESVPRFHVKTRGVDIQIDSFYGDLDRDGIVEGPVTRVLGSPRAMMNQLAMPAPGPASAFNALFYTANGELQYDMIVGNYLGHPPGVSRGRGELSVRVISDKRLEKVVGSGGGFGGNVWTR
jgi:hypothetical protein